ncbi:hypothetical protein [Flavobacterium pedocola]
MKNILFFLVFIVFVNCDPGDDKLRIINNTNHVIVIGDRLWLPKPEMYSNDKSAIDNFDFKVNQIKPKSSLKLIRKGDWESRFLENDTIVILVFNRDSIIEKRLKKPSENYDIEQIIYVSKKYVELNNWTVKVDSAINQKIIKI